VIRANGTHSNRDTRAANHECQTCGKPDQTQGYCHGCAEPRTKTVNDRHKVLREEGRCHCGEPLAPGLCECLGCRFHIKKDLGQFFGVIYKVGQEPSYLRSLDKWMQTRCEAAAKKAGEPIIEREFTLPDGTHNTIRGPATTVLAHVARMKTTAQKVSATKILW
jgi:hypothetical protein